MTKQLKLADQLGARMALIYGENELSQGVVKVRCLKTEGSRTSSEELVAFLQNQIKKSQ